MTLYIRLRVRGDFNKLLLCCVCCPGNQGLMDILDMPNTNKYTFEG